MITNHSRITDNNITEQNTKLYFLIPFLIDFNHFMAYIYKIQNNLTGRTYVGMTKQPAERRWVQHKLKAKNLSGNATELHTAMHKEGIEHFTFTILEECSISIVSEREVHWINELNSYENGYNQMLPNSKRKGNNLMRKYH